MSVGKDHLVVKVDGDLVDATMSIRTVPADEVGPAHRKYNYELSNGRSISYGYTRRDALEMLLAVAAERGWAVYQPLSRLDALDSQRLPGRFDSRQPGIQTQTRG